MMTFWQQTRTSFLGVWSNGVHFLKTLTFIKLSRILLVFFLLFFPFEVRSLVYSVPFYASGEFNYYTSFFVYLSDICFIGALFCWGMSLWKKETTMNFTLGDSMLTFILLAMLLVMVGNIFFVAQPELQFFLAFRFVELFLLYLMVANRVLRQEQLVWVLLFGLCFQALIGIYQYILQSSIGLNFLGEATVNTSTLGIGKIYLGSQTILRAFGTLPHANVLGGLLFMGILYAIALIKKYRWFIIGILSLLSMGLLFSFSRSAFFALIVAFLIYISIQNSKIVFKYVVLAASILCFLIVVFNLQNVIVNRFLFEDTASTQERALYLKIGANMLFKQPLGVGLGGFTLNMQDYTFTKLVPWLYQPVHNVFLLMANESGIIGGVLFLALFVYCFWQLLMVARKQKNPDNRFAVSLLLAILVGIGVIGCFDHYFLTIYQGQVMLFIYLGFVSSLLNSTRLPSKNS